MPDKFAALGAALRLQPGRGCSTSAAARVKCCAPWGRDHGVVDRVRFVHDDAAGHVAEDKVDVAACIGATRIAGGFAGTAELLARSLRPWGIILIGEPCWRQSPPTDEVAQGCQAHSIADFLM